MFPLTFPSCRHTGELLAASSGGHKNSISSFALLFIHAHLDKVTDAKEKENPVRDLAGHNGKSVSIRRSPRVTNCVRGGVLAVLAEWWLWTVQPTHKYSV